jgi:type I restriction enzyme M protein
MSELEYKELGKTLWDIADELRGAMNADDFRDYMLSFLFLRYLSDNYEAATKKELGADFPDNSATPNITPLQIWYNENSADIAMFEKQMRIPFRHIRTFINLTKVNNDLSTLFFSKQTYVF